jgi:hypothetical protein
MDYLFFRALMPYGSISALKKSPLLRNSRPLGKEKVVGEDDAGHKPRASLAA